jgi:hypothetical protein
MHQPWLRRIKNTLAAVGSVLMIFLAIVNAFNHDYGNAAVAVLAEALLMR